MEQRILYGLLNMTAHIGGTVLLSLQFGWKTGLGTSLLVYFLKDRERP